MVGVTIYCDASQALTLPSNQQLHALRVRSVILLGGRECTAKAEVRRFRLLFHELLQVGDLTEVKALWVQLTGGAASSFLRRILPRLHGPVTARHLKHIQLSLDFSYFLQLVFEVLHVHIQLIQLARLKQRATRARRARLSFLEADEGAILGRDAHGGRRVRQVGDAVGGNHLIQLE